MRPIAYITGTFPAWSETFIRQEIALLLEAGVPLELVTIQAGNGPQPPGMPTPFVLKPDAEATGPAASATHSLPLPGMVRRIASLHRHADALQRLIAFCQERQIGHLYGAFLDLPGLLTAAAAKELKLPYSLSFHANDALMEKYDMAFLTDEATALFACNQSVYNQVLQRHAHLTAKTHLVPHGLDLTAWPERSAPWTPHQPLRLLFVGRLVAKKRPNLAMQVLRTLNATGTESHLTVIGDGPLADELTDPHLTLAGVQPPDAIRTAMQQADLLLVTSEDLPNGDQEGLPNIILEAMATGLPIVATPAGSITELLSEENGYPVADHDPATIAEAVRNALANPATTRTRLQAARHAIETHYDARHLIHQRLKLAWP